MWPRMLVFAAGACSAERGAPPVRVVDPPALRAPPDAPLARGLTVSFDRPVWLDAAVTGVGEPQTVRFPLADRFDVPLLGFPAGATSTVSLTATDPVTGDDLALDPLEVTTDPLPASFPTIEVLTADADRAEPGYWLVSLGVPGGEAWLAALDARDHSVRWLYTGEIDWGDVRMTDRGTLLGLWGGVHEVDLLGETIRRWVHPELSAVPGIDVPIPWQVLHHEVHPLPDGSMLSLVGQRVRVDAYPTSYDDPTPNGPADIADDRVVWFDADGFALGDLPLSSALDTARIGFGSLLVVGGAFDWVHANAVVPDPAGGFVVSSRHQDALVRFDADGALSWILGDPAGWSPAFAPYLLAPEGAVRWPYHQHGHNFGPDGRLVAFDNRMVVHTPYDPPPDEVPASRVVAWDIDTAAMTVREAWSWEPEEVLLSNALGNAVWLPETGHVLAAWGFLDGEGSVDNASIGRGRKHARLIEIEPGSAAAVVDVRLSIDAAVEPEGLKVYRVTHLPSLYGPGR